MLNINELANALKPVVLPGEFMQVFILKEGKEYNQGVAYLDDGTMVVVDNARRLIGKTIDIVVTSVLQTTAGQDDLRPPHRSERTAGAGDAAGAAAHGPAGGSGRARGAGPGPPATVANADASPRPSAEQARPVRAPRVSPQS